MTLDEYKSQQKVRLAEFKELSRTDKDRFRREARERLLAAQIIDDNGSLSSRYR